MGWRKGELTRRKNKSSQSNGKHRCIGIRDPGNVSNVFEVFGRDVVVLGVGVTNLGEGREVSAKIQLIPFITSHLVGIVVLPHFKVSNNYRNKGGHVNIRTWV